MGTRERQQRERDRTRDAILTAARDLFVRDGYLNVSIRKIAERIEYSPAALYSYFPSKDDIFFALAEEGFQRLAAYIQTALEATTDPFERLRRGLSAFYEFSKVNPEYFALMFVDRSVPSLSQDFQRFEFFQDLTARAEADIQACIERQLFSRDLNPAAALHVLWVGVLGAATIGLSHRLAPGEDPDALAHDVIESLLAGFTTPMRTTFVASPCAFHTADGGLTPVSRARVRPRTLGHKHA
jgi:AcrR family transcriptional regulator